MRFGHLSCVGCTLGAVPTRAGLPYTQATPKESARSASAPPLSPNGSIRLTTFPMNMPLEPLAQGRDAPRDTNIVPVIANQDSYVPPQPQPYESELPIGVSPSIVPTTQYDPRYDPVIQAQAARNFKLALAGIAALAVFTKTGRKLAVIGGLGAGALYYAVTHGLLSKDAEQTVIDAAASTYYAASEATLAVTAALAPTSPPRPGGGYTESDFQADLQREAEESWEKLSPSYRAAHPEQAPGTFSYGATINAEVIR